MGEKKCHTVPFYKFIRQSNKIVKNPLPFHRANFDAYGDYFKVSLGPKTAVLFTRNAGFAKHILQGNHKNYHKSELQTHSLGKYIGKGLLTANGAFWLKQRRLIQPAFHKKNLLLLLDIMYDEIRSNLKVIKEDEAIAVFPIMNDLAFNVVAKSLFSYKDQDNVTRRLQFITEAVQEMIIKEVRQPFKRWWYVVNGSVKRTKALSNEARGIVDSFINTRKVKEKSFNDLLDMLLETRYEDGSAMPQEQLIDEILILFIAGYETTSNALTFTIHLLAQHPDLQEKVYNEVLAANFDDLMERIQQLPYTKQCIEEAMRLYPPAYFTDRKAIATDTYEGITLRKNEKVLLSIYEMHRHEAYWEEPETFNPDRFHSSRKKEYSAHYFPFGAGPRMCIGNNFAMYEMILTISELIKNYRVTTNDPITLKPLITLKPGAAKFKFTKR